MKEEQKKIELLRKIAHRLNEAHVQWALGASMLLKVETDICLKAI